MTQALVQTLEDGKRGRRWRVRVMQAGLSGNASYYPADVLREATPLFDGVRVFVKGDKEHLAGEGKDFRNLIGRLTKPQFVEGGVSSGGEIVATLDVLESAGGIAARMLEAWKRGFGDAFGFSIDAVGAARTGHVKGRTVRIAEAIKSVRSVDLRCRQPTIPGLPVEQRRLANPMLPAQLRRLGSDRMQPQQLDDLLLRET